MKALVFLILTVLLAFTLLGAAMMRVDSQQQTISRLEAELSAVSIEVQTLQTAKRALESECQGLSVTIEALREQNRALQEMLTSGIIALSGKLRSNVQPVSGADPGTRVDFPASMDDPWLVGLLVVAIGVLALLLLGLIQEHRQRAGRR